MMRDRDDPGQWHGAHIVDEQELSFSSDGQAKRRARKRQNIVFSVMALLVIAVLAGAVLVFNGTLKLGGEPAAVASPKPSETKIENPKCPAIDFKYQKPSDVEIRVLNTTDISGLAGDTAEALEKRGFKISSLTSGWKSLSETTGAVIAGPDGYAQAFTVQRQIPGIVFIYDEKKWGSRVDLALGEKFDGLEKERKLDTSEGKLVCSK
ncbi:MULTISPECIES: LytR C-terminal domain-containing protein [Micrococcaceae]|uniref:LytR C-terminal domain-containing protein n=2 Tax=Actinomycetota TaxID=201174 RepID=UPI000CFBFF4D|nr:LytR C-terminal domain-containing protein [Arthrobacter sp. MYb214]PRB74587.1 hypothetical protein CQ012_13115 [Arthrobacter sp. MYb214]